MRLFPGKFWPLLAFVLLFTGGCATLPPATVVSRDIGFELLDSWRAQSTRFHSLQGLAKIRLEFDERTLAGSQVVVAEIPDRLRAETLSPFGSPILILAVNASELNALLPGDNVLYRGRPTPENLGRFTQLPLRLEDLVGVLMFRPPLVDSRELTTYLLPDGGWRVDLEAGPRRQRLIFDAARHLVEVRYFSRNELQLQLLYGDFDRLVPGMPARMSLELPVQQTRVNLVFSDLAMNQSPSPELFRLKAPPETVVRWLDGDVSAADGTDQAEAEAAGK